MASAARPDNPAQKSKGPAEIVLMPNADEVSIDASEKPQVQRALEEYGKPASEILCAREKAASRVYDQAWMQAADEDASAGSRARAFTEGTRSHAQRIKQEHPLRLLAIVAATGFATGVIVRMWRSRNS
jgi:hypothetical protein